MSDLSSSSPPPESAFTSIDRKVDGTFFSGQLTAAVPAVLSREHDGWRVVAADSGDELTQQKLTDSRVSDRLADVPRYVLFADGASFETFDNAAMDKLAPPSRSQRWANFVHRLETHAKFAAVATVLVVVSVAAGFKYGLPRLANQVAHSLPDSIEESLGSVSIEAFDAFSRYSSLTYEERNRVGELLAEVTPNDVVMPTLQFRDLGELPNAFALPGNQIVVTDALARLLDDAEMRAVLAHEVGHLQERHAEQQMLLGSTSLLLISAVTGDLSVLASFAGTIPLTLLQSGYSRDFERSADEWAATRLIELELDPAALASALDELEASLPGPAAQFSYLSSHPTNEERTQEIRDRGRAAGFSETETAPETSAEP